MAVIVVCVGVWLRQECRSLLRGRLLRLLHDDFVGEEPSTVLGSAALHADIACGGFALPCDVAEAELYVAVNGIRLGVDILKDIKERGEKMKRF